MTRDEVAAELEALEAQLADLDFVTMPLTASEVCAWIRFDAERFTLRRRWAPGDHELVIEFLSEKAQRAARQIPTPVSPVALLASSLDRHAPPLAGHRKELSAVT